MLNQPQHPPYPRGGHPNAAATSSSRRRLLGWTAGGGAALLGALLPKGRSTESVQAQTPTSIVGSWVITFSQETGPGNDPNEHQVISFTSDGIVLNTNLPSTPPQPDQGPPTRTYSTEGQGVWTAAGTGQVRLKFVSVDIDEQGKFADLVQISATLALSANGNSFMGSFQVVVSDGAGGVLFDSQGDAGMVQGTRITV